MSTQTGSFDTSHLLFIRMEPGTTYMHKLDAGSSVLCYVFEGSALFGADQRRVGPSDAVVMGHDGKYGHPK